MSPKTVPEATTARPDPAPSSGRPAPAQRSRIGNGRLPAGVSGCSAQARRFCEILADLNAELGELTAAEQLTARTVATCTLHVEQLQADLLRGEAVDGEALTRASNAQARAINALKRGRSARKPAQSGRARLQALAAELEGEH